MRRLFAVVLLVLAACHCDSGERKREQQDWRVVGPFARRRTVLKDGVRDFPAPVDARRLKRCRPNRYAVLLLSYNTARALYAPDAPPAPDFDAPKELDIGGHRQFLERIEQAEWARAPGGERSVWSKPPFDYVADVALFKPSRVVPAVAGACEDTPVGKRCTMAEGLVEGDLVVLGGDGNAKCANAIRIEGPDLAFPDLVVKLGDEQRVAVSQILEGFFYRTSESVPSPPTWSFLSLSQVETSPVAHCTVIVDGDTIQSAAPRR